MIKNKLIELLILGVEKRFLLPLRVKSDQLSNQLEIKKHSQLNKNSFKTELKIKCDSKLIFMLNVTQSVDCQSEKSQHVTKKNENQMFKNKVLCRITQKI